ncbi:MAG: DUF4340 domain-containing protein [Chloroflexota bacterium]
MTTEAIETPTNSEESSERPTFSRLNLILLVALVIQAGLAAFMLWPSGGGVEAGVPLLGEIDASAVTALTITEGENSVDLAKTDGAWVLANADGFPTTENRVTEVLEKILAVDGNRLVTQTSNSHKRLQVAADDFVRKVDVTTSDGTQTLYVGSSAGSGATHVRLDGSDAAYLTNQIASFELNSSSSGWIDTQYFNITANDVSGFMLENGNGTFTFERGPASTDGSTREWSLAELGEGEILDQTKVNTLLNQATSLRLAEPVGKSDDASFGFGSPSASVTFTVEEPVAAEGGESQSDGESSEPQTETQTYTVQMGSNDEEGSQFYAKASNSDYYVLVSQFNGNQLVDKSQADFLAEPEEGEEVGDDATSSSESDSIFESLSLTETVSSESVVSETAITDTAEITETTGLTETGEITETTESAEADTDTDADETEAEETTESDEGTEPTDSSDTSSDEATSTDSTEGTEISDSADITDSIEITNSQEISVTTPITDSP